MKLEHIIYYTEARYKYFLELIGKTTIIIYPAISGSNDEALSTPVKIVSVDKYGADYIKITYEKV